MASRQLHSTTFTLVYIAMVTGSLLIMIWAFAVDCPSPVFHYADSLVTAFLAYEILIRYLAVGSIVLSPAPLPLPLSPCPCPCPCP